MGAIFTLLAVIALIILAYLGVEEAGLRQLFGVWVPYAAVVTFFVGFVWRIVDWARSPVPFSIPTTCGQQETLPWIKANKIDNPCTPGAVVVRMALEVLLFRSLFRNTYLDARPGPKIAYGESKWLWLFAILFHYTFLVTLIRHLRFFTLPVPSWLGFIEGLDGFLEVGMPIPVIGADVPILYLSGVILGGAVTMLLLRRFILPKVRYISLPADYFPLWLILAIAATGILMRYFLKTDIVAVKELTMGLVGLHPVVPKSVGVIFFIHVFLVSVLFAYFPFSKLMHLGGVFLSPTRNLPNDSRAKRYVNPWNYPVKFHTYAAYEDDFREAMVEAGIPVDKQPEAAAEDGKEG